MALFLTLTLSAQTAAFSTSGTGANQDEIIWLTWDHVDSGSYTTSGLQNGTTTGGITNGTVMTYNLPDGAVLDVTFTAINFTPWQSGTCQNTSSDANKNCGYQPGDMMTTPGVGSSGDVWSGGALQYGYFIPGKEILFSNIGPGTGGEPGQDAQEITFTMNFTMTIGGVSVPVDVVFSDSETTNPSSSTAGGGPYQEEIHATTNATPWALIENVGSTNYQATGVGTTEVIITDSEQSGTPRGVPIYITTGTGATTSIDYEFLFEGETAGHQGFIVGVLYPKDHGDAPDTYGDAMHYQDMGGGAGPSLVSTEPYYLGSLRGDAEDVANFSGDATGDGADEDGVVFPTTIEQGTNTIGVTDTGNGVVNIWIDFDNSGTFEPGEQIATDAATSPTSFTAPGAFQNTTTFARVRYCSAAGLCNTPTGIAPDGEVEDYLVNINLLPIELGFFDAELKSDGNVELNWQTLSEDNNDRFEIERSSDGANFDLLQTIAGAGTSNQPIDYSYIDTSVPNGKVYYRLKQVDFSTIFSYSDIRIIDKEGSSQIDIWPNPLRNGRELVVFNTQESMDHVLILDVQGRVLANLGKIDRNSQQSVGMPDLVSGIYFLQFTSKTGTTVKKLVID